MLRLLALCLGLTALAACDVQTTLPGSDTPATPVGNIANKVRAEQAVRRFIAVVDSVEPVAEQECRNRTSGLNCDFKIVVDDRPGQPPNAFQTRESSGRPIVAFNLALIAMAENEDELAFVMGHEASHHIRDHLGRQQEAATAGAILMGGLASIGGGNAEAVRSAQELGAMVGARSYSKDYELEADQLGTIIAARAGYDPLKGAQFFNRIPDPGNRFLGTHPPNRDRMEIVRRTAAGM
ncbi:M48 family metallopeptidase [Mesobacterium pallidum]|uniref:M48 family metallopeptidase n=1 Tax=Mesobacterium pallidum TaxID=2872037 RepID=UPI001EE384DD|nr:M48 family metallopeptidase [Mesobacterium pallidum]